MWFQKDKKTEKETTGPAEYIPIERRKFERIRNILTILCAKTEKPIKFTIYTENISEGGIKGITQEPSLEKDEILELIILLHSIHTRFNAMGRVAWVNKISGQQYDVGIEFTKIEESDREKFKNYMLRFKNGSSD